MILSKSAKSKKPEGKKPSEPKEGQNKNRKRSCDQSQKKREPPQFTLINITYQRLLPLIRDLLNFKWPAPIQIDPSQRNSFVRCDYHRDHGHETNRYRSLKLLVEKLLKAGHVKRYVKEVDCGEESEPPADRITAGAIALPETKPTINYILGGPSDDQYQSKRQ